MKNRLQFNRIPRLFETREQANEFLRNYVDPAMRPEFIPLVGEPIVARYKDDEGHKQLILAVGKSVASGNVEYHFIDTAFLKEGIDSATELAENAESVANQALDLASAATKDVANYLVILKNMIGESGVELEDGSYFDDDDPSNCGIYKPLENSNYLDEAKSFRDADKKLDDVLGQTNIALDNLSGATASFTAETSNLFKTIIAGAGLDNASGGSYAGHDETHIIKDAESLDNADVLLDAAISELSASTIAAINETNNNLSELSAATINLSAGTVAVDAKVDELSANTMAADQVLDNKIGELSANTMAADEVLDNKIDELSANTMAADQALEDEIGSLANRKVLGVSAITVNVLENGDSKVSLLINEEDDKVITQNALGLKANVSLVYSREDKKIYLKGKNDITISTIDATDFIKDGMLDSASVFTATEADHEQYPELIVGKTYIKLLFNADAEQPGKANPVFISADDLVDTYTIDPESHTFVEINDYVIKLNVDKEDGLASYNYARNISAVTANIISATGLNMGEQGGYPGHDETHYIKNAGNLDQADVLLDEAVWGNNQGLAEISATTDSFSSATHTVIENILAGTGLNAQEPGEYHGHDDTHFIKDATSLDNADVLLDESVWTVSGMVVGFDERITELEEDVAAVDNRITLLSGVTAEFSAATNAKIEELSARTVDLGEVYDYIDSADTAIHERIDDIEEVAAGAINDLNRRVGYFETHYTGEYIPLTGYEIASGLSEDELILDDNDSVNEAFGKIQKQILDNEEAVAAGLNDLFDRTEANARAIAENTGVTVLSAAVVSFSAATTNKFNEVNNSITNVQNNVTALGNDVNDLSAFTQFLSGHSLGILTVNLNGVEQGKYCPSASTTLNLEAIQEVTGADVLLTGYELATGTTEEELTIVATDTVNEALGKVQKQAYDNEAVTAGALNDLDGRIIELSAATISLGGDVFNGVDYDTDTKRINFYHGSNVVDYVDATAFIKDGMLDNVKVITSGGEQYLSFIFNTDSGKETINIKVSDFAALYTAGNGIDISAENAIGLKLASKGDTSFIGVDGDGLYLTGVSAMAGNVQALSGATATLSASVVTNNNNITELSAATTGISNNMTMLSAATTGISDGLAALSAASVTMSGNINENRTNINTLSASIIDDELVIAAAFNDLNRRVIEISGNTGGGGGQTNVQSDWAETDTSSDAYIKNKPYVPKIEKVTTAEYNALTTKDSDTLYILVD